ncbi:MAG: mRNA-decapping enzyme subunit 2 [Candelina mexicana]|nr:MAG: mRNA-decapping enzyme subunit 2 [Candelina mexicana]
MLNEAMDEVVLVKGWKKGANWSFPRGKINKDEKDLDCAVREVYEETGFDLKEAGLVGEGPQMKYIEVTMREQHMRLYVFRGVPTDTHFEPRTRKEISKIQWYKLSELPTLKKVRQQQGRGEDLAINANKFYMVAPFLVPLKKWIHQQIKHDVLRGSAGEHLAPAEVEQLMAEEATSAAEIIPTPDEAPAAPMAQLPRPLEVDRSATAREIPNNAQPTEDASAQLKRLLSVKDVTSFSRDTPPVGANPSSANVPDPSALLALLRNGGANSNSQHPSQTLPLQTPMEQIIATPMMPEPPHHQHSRPPHMSRLPPPPSFPFPNLDPREIPIHPSQRPPLAHPTVTPNTARPNSNTPKFFAPSDVGSGRTAPLHSPLFLAPPMHGPILPPYLHDDRQIPRPYQRTGDPNFVQAPQFANLPAPIIPPASKLPPPKLTSHSLALLNVFKSAKLAASPDALGPDNVNGSTKPHIDTFTKPAGSQKQEGQDHAPTSGLPKNPKTWSQSHAAHKEHTVEANGSLNGAPRSGLTLPSSKPRNQHQDALLDLFRKPSAVIEKTTPSRTSKPTLAPVELSAQPSPAIVRRDLVQDVEAAVKPANRDVMDRYQAGVPNTTGVEPHSLTPGHPAATVSGPLNLPHFDVPATREGKPERPLAAKQTTNGTDRKRATPTSILARSASAQAPQMVDGQPLRRPPKVPAASEQPSSQESKRFQPQILRRPAQLGTQEKAGNVPAPLSQPPLKPRVIHPTDHKQSLLSLFSIPSAAEVPSPSSFSTIVSPMTQKLDTTGASPPRSRVGSVTSLKGDEQGRKLPGSGSQTPRTPVNKSFLLGYLEGVVKGELR